MIQISEISIRPRYLLLFGALMGTLSTPGYGQMMCSGELHVGYYLEDPLNNPEDPVPGSLFLNIPDSDGAFAGEMYFTYQGCQSENLGAVAGTRQSNSLSGNWAGTVDNTSQSGGFVGSQANPGVFSGTYSVDGGKQQIVVEDCVEYFIAANGTWTLSSINQPAPNDDLIDYLDGRITWQAVDNALFAHCQLIDVARANCNESSAVLWQSLAQATAEQIDIPLDLLVDGDEYLVSCGQFDDQAAPLAFSKALFVQDGVAVAPALFADGFESTGNSPQ